MWNFEALREIILTIIILGIILILFLKVDTDILLLVTSILFIIAITKNYLNLKKSGQTVFIISSSIKSKWGVAWIGIGLIYLIPETIKAFQGIMDIKYFLRGTTQTLLGIIFLQRVIDKNRITTKGLVIDNKLHQWIKIISWNWKFQDTSTLILLIPKKSRRKPVAEITLDVPTELVEQVNKLLYKYLPDKFSQSKV